MVAIQFMHLQGPHGSHSAQGDNGEGDDQPPEEEGVHQVLKRRLMVHEGAPDKNSKTTNRPSLTPTIKYGPEASPYASMVRGP